ncbi:hypothetical protein [Flavobacterium sp. 1355]|uniref:hypothetical protein n=1 Tax=Flavobacterium sp. 1355 TaxID=2806571 RepID=UPI001AE62F3C|nr:hypothetical protein [Flavobacterium sp. 1355]MBP1222907.1 putative nucleic acid-binding Zn-ribbon protein [Flavobacterium sp. 1355]
MSEEKIAHLEKRIDKLEYKIDKIISTLKDLAPALDGNFVEIKDKLDSLEVKVDKLDGSTEQGFKEVKWELQKIQDVTKYADEYSNIPPAKA